MTGAKAREERLLGPIHKSEQEFPPCHLDFAVSP